jgi:serine protease Do
LDKDGNVIGIVVAMLDAQSVFNITGSLPQNVNYAVKSAYAQVLLDNVPEAARKLIPKIEERTVDNVAERVKESVVIIVTY